MDYTDDQQPVNGATKAMRVLHGSAPSSPVAGLVSRGRTRIWTEVVHARWRCV